MNIIKLLLHDLQEIYLPKIYPIKLDNSDYTSQIKIVNDRYVFDDLHVSIIEEFFSKLIFTKTVKDGFLTIKSVESNNIVKSNRCIPFNNKHYNLSIFIFNQEQLCVFFIDGIIFYYYKKLKKLYHSDTYLYGRTNYKGRNDISGDYSNKWIIDKKEIYGTVICHRIFNHNGLGIQKIIDNVIPSLNRIIYEKNRLINKYKFNKYIKFSKIIGHYIWFHFIEFEYLISNNLIDNIDKIYYNFARQDWFHFKDLFNKYPNKFIKSQRNPNLLYLDFIPCYINEKTRALFNYNINKIYNPTINITSYHKKYKIDTNNFKILLNLKKNKRVCLNGDLFMIKTINSILDLYPNTLFYFTGVFNMTNGNEYMALNDSYNTIKDNIKNKKSIINLNGLDIRLIYEMSCHMNYSIGQTGSGPRETAEWMGKLSTFVIEKHYGHCVTPFICYKKFIKNYGMDKCKIQECLIDTNLTPIEQKKLPIIDISSFTLTENDIDDRIKLILSSIQTLI